MNNYKKLAVSSAIAFAGACNTAYAAIQYIVTPLTPLLSHSEASGINANGQVAAWGFNAGGSVKAFNFDTQSSNYLGSFYARDNNDRGDAVGRTEGPAWHAVIYHQGQLTNIGSLVDRGGISYANGINNAGQVVGNGGSAAFLYEAGNVTWLANVFGGNSVTAWAISNTGFVTGSAATSNPGQVEQAYLYKNGTTLGLGTLGGAYSWGNAVNDSGQVVGDSFTSTGETHAFLYLNNQMLDISPAGTNSSSATGVNSAGQVVGTYALGFNGIPGAATFRGFLYSNGTVVDLNSLIDPAGGWDVDMAHAINDRGQIAATGCNSTSCTALLLTPVPEPSTALSFVFGLVLLGLMKRQRHH